MRRSRPSSGHGSCHRSTCWPMRRSRSAAQLDLTAKGRAHPRDARALRDRREGGPHPGRPRRHPVRPGRRARASSSAGSRASPTTSRWPCPRGASGSRRRSRASRTSASRSPTPPSTSSRSRRCWPAATSPRSRSRSKLAFALGQDVAGQPFSADLSKMPHMLIAGATGSGKSVCVNAHHRQLPDERDARRGEAHPHRPEASRAGAVQGHPAPAVRGDRRARQGGQRPEVDGRDDGEPLRRVRRPRRSQHRRATTRRCGAGEPRMPYIVIVIDELADLMMVSAYEVEVDDHPHRPAGARHRHPPRRGHAASVGAGHHRPDQGQHPDAASPSR